MKPLTQLYGFFDGENVTKYCVPKLLEISMKTGTFQVGETITGTVPITAFRWWTWITNDNVPSIRFRVAQSNHKEGPYNVAYKNLCWTSPYTNQPIIIPSSYSSTSDYFKCRYILSIQWTTRWLFWLYWRRYGN